MKIRLEVHFHPKMNESSMKMTTFKGVDAKLYEKERLKRAKDRSNEKFDQGCQAMFGETHETLNKYMQTTQ